MKQVMIDIETLATCNEAAVLSIGACQFDPATGSVSNPFLVSVPKEFYLDDTQEIFTVDEKTVQWWATQGDDAKKALSINVVPTPYIAFDRLLEWFADIEFEKTWKFGEQAVWANPPQFDLTILRHLAKRSTGSVDDVPWHWRQERDVRTVRALNWPKNQPTLPDACDGLVAHRADHDAIKQAYEVMEYLRP